jgi:FkbM family methyltransferase
MPVRPLFAAGLLLVTTLVLLQPPSSRSQPLSVSYPNIGALDLDPTTLNRIGVTLVKPLHTSSNSFHMALPLPPSNGPSIYPGQSVIDALWSSGSWSLKESVVASLIFRSFCDVQTDVKGLMIDGGSHIGYFSHLALSHNCEVVAVEPFAPSRDFVSYTASLNGKSASITIVPALVSDIDDEAGLPFDGWQVVHPSKATSTIPSVRLDTIMLSLYPSLASDNPAERIVYIKLDVEGHESSAISGLSRLTTLPNPPLSIYLELTTYDKTVPGTRDEQALRAADLLIALSSAGTYNVLPLQGSWSSPLVFLPLSSSTDLASMIISNQDTGCFDPTVGVCITEVIGVHNLLSSNFVELASAALDAEMSAVKEDIAQRVAAAASEVTEDERWAALSSKKTDDVLTDDTGPRHTIYVRDPNAPEDQRRTIEINYPFNLHILSDYFKDVGGVCEQASFNEAECNNVLKQTRQYIKEHSAKQLGVGEISN